MPRTQINFRLDTELLTAIKAKCEEKGINVTKFLTDAARRALGFETMQRTITLSPGTLERLETRLADVEKCLANNLVSLEEKEAIESRLTELETQQQGESAA